MLPIYEVWLELATFCHDRVNFIYSSRSVIISVNLIQVGEVCFSYSVAHEGDSRVEKWSSEDDMEPYRTVIVFPADKLPIIVDRIKQERAESVTWINVVKLSCFFFFARVRWGMISGTIFRSPVRKYMKRMLAYLSTKCSWWAIVIGHVHRPSCVVCRQQFASIANYSWTLW